MAIREDLGLFAAGETMLEAVDKVAEEHERNLRLALLLLAGVRALETKPADPGAVAESFMLKLLSLSGFHPSLSACAVCGAKDPQLFSPGMGGAVCPNCAEGGVAPVSHAALVRLQRLAVVNLNDAGDVTEEDLRVRKESRGLLYGFAEYYLERRMRSLPMLARSAP